jgi:glucose-1-phosphate adenylyltransferase
MINEGSMIFGEVENSVIFPGVRIGKGAQVKNSVIMPFTVIAENACIDHAIVAQNCEIAAGARVTGAEGAIVVVPEGETVLPVDGSKQVG